MSQPDMMSALAGSTPVPCKGDAPVFAEPWQAQAFALTLALHGRGLFTWPEWAEALSTEIAEHGGRDDGARYYEFWLHALEDLLVAKGASSHGDVSAVADAWARAAEATPHGSPITLANDPLTRGVLAAAATTQP